MSNLTHLSALKRFLFGDMEEASASPSERGQQRLRRITLTALASIGFRGAMFLSGIIYIPLTVHYLGPERFGLWVAMTSVITLLVFADCGLGYGLMNHIAYANGAGDKDSIRKAISSTFFVLCGIALLGCLLLAIAYPFIPWQAAFRTRSPLEASEAALAVTVMAASFLLTLPFTTVQRVQAAYQEGFETQLWEIAGVLLSLFGLLAAIRAHAGLPVLAVVFSLGPLLAVVLNYLVYFFVRRPSEAPAFKLLDLHMARKIVREGGYFFVLQIAAALVFSIDSFVILHYYGQAALGQYNLTAKLFQIAPLLAGVWFAPLWPAYAEAIARKDFDWVRRTLLRSTVAASLGCAVVSLGAALWARPIVRLWTGVDVDPSLWVLGGLAAFSVLLVSTSAISTYLNGSNFIKGQVTLVIAATVLSVVFKIVLSKYWNISGAIWGTNLGYLLVIVPAYFFIVPRLLRNQRSALQNRASPLDLVRLYLKHAVAALVVAAIYRRERPKTLSDSPRILVTRLDGIGDFIMTTPFLRELRRNFSESTITLVVRESAAPLATACPYVDRVLILDSFPARRTFSAYLQYLRAFWDYLGYLRDFAKRHLAGQIDIAIQPRWDVDLEWASLVTWLSGAARTVGYTEKTSPEKALYNAGQNRLFTDILAPGPEPHEADRSLEIIRHLGGTIANRDAEAWWTPQDQASAERFFEEHRLPRTGCLIAFGIGASSARRHWPGYGELMILIAEQLDFTPLLFVGPGEEHLAVAIAVKVPSAIVVQGMPLGVVAALLARCSAFVGNDSGPMHLAAAVGLPVVEVSCHPEGGDLRHVNSPNRTGPVTRQMAVVRPKTFVGLCRGGCLEDAPHCIATIRPEEVATALLHLLGGDAAQLESSPRKVAR